MHVSATASRAAAVLVLLLTTAVLGVPQPASAAPLGITLVQLRPSVVELTVVCPTDPPTTVLVFAGAAEPRIVGQRPMDCVGGGVRQRVTVPLTETFAVGARVDLTATVSGDSGEINASFPGTFVESGAPAMRAPGKPTGVRVRVGSRRAIVTWHHPVRRPAAPVEGFRVWLRGRHVKVPATTHRVVLRGLRPSRRYVVRVAAYNDAGRSKPVVRVVHTCHR